MRAGVVPLSAIDTEERHGTARPALPAEGPGRATAYRRAHVDRGAQILRYAPDGNLNLGLRPGLVTAGERAPAIPVEVLVGVRVDFANEIAALAAKDE